MVSLSLQLKVCAESYTTVAFFFHPFLLLESGKPDKVKYADKKYTTVYTVLHNSNLEIHGF